MTLMAYDIDGVLTSSEGRADFNTARKSENAVGIVTARSEESMNSFIEENGLNPDFARATNIKFRTLMELDDEYGEEEKFYVGSGARDRVASKIAGWNFRLM